MNNYKTSILSLYELKSTLILLKDEYANLQEELANGSAGDLRRQLQIIEKRITQTNQKINDSIQQLYTDPLTDPLLQIEEQNPILLLPLRLETRFEYSAAELWIRVFPDDISIHTHESALTASETKAGSYYWKELWTVKKSLPSDFDTQRKKAWSQVANRFGMNRATWILLQTRPLKLKPNEDFSNILVEADLDPGPVETKYQAWSEAAKSYVMPDLLKLRLFIKDKLVFETQGKPIVQPLTVSPDPKSTTSTANLDWKGAEFAWLEDFVKAVEVGMAFRIKLSGIPNYNPADGFSRITVMGIRTLFDKSPLADPPPMAGTKALSRLFENHQYTSHGLALVSQGTPTNNTEEKKSGYSVQPAFSEKRYQQEQDLQQALQTNSPDEMEDGKILAFALGLDPALFEKVENSQNTDHRDAVLMNKALYPATLGFFLRHLLHPLFTTDELDTIRSFFCSYVTGRGPLPALRIGPQPYGVLPTSNFKAFQWNAQDKNSKLYQQLTALLTELDSVFEASIPNIPQLGQKKDPHQLLDEILGLYPNSETFYQRVGYSESFLRNFLGQTITQPSNPLLDQLIARFSTYGGFAQEGILQLKRIVYERTTLRLNQVRLVDVVLTSETKKISVPDAIGRGENYIQWLADKYIRDFQTPSAGIDKSYYPVDSRIDPPILYQLLKHSLLTQLYKCIFHWLRVEGFLASDLSIFHNGTTHSKFIGAKEYFNFIPNQDDMTPMELMSIQDSNLLPFLSLGNDETTAAYFLQNTDAILNGIRKIFRRRMQPEILNDFRILNEFFSSLKNLADLSTGRLERAMIEHIDCLTYRLDSWQTALFYKKLESNRNTGLATGTVLGAYGWLENLKPAENINYIKETDLPLELQPHKGLPILVAEDHGGYIHAPSLTQAKTAALLRNAYLHYHDPADPGMMAVNLSSSRVRKALDIFEGIQKGHSVGELLGYRLERHLHDQAKPLDKYISEFRKAFPLGGKMISNPASTDQSSANQGNKPASWVARLDGLALINEIKDKKDYPSWLTQLLGPAVLQADAVAIKEGTDDLLDCIDAMKDLIVMESIYQMVQGNTDRAGALLKSIHELKPPSKFESIRTPRTPAEILTHRACVLFNSVDFSNPPNPWPTVLMSQKAVTEPMLNAWLGEIIGDPYSYQCRVSDAQSQFPTIITIEDLKLQPIDLVYLVPMQFGKEESEFSRRIVYYYRVTNNVPEEIDVKIEFDQAEKYSSMVELLPLLKLLKEVITNSKALDAADFDLQHYQGKANFRNLSVKKSANVIDLGALQERKSNLTQALKLLYQKLRSKTSRATKCADIRQCLIECCEFDIHDAFPKSTVGEGAELKETLLIQTEDILHQIRIMINTVENITPNVDGLVQSFAIIFGPAFKVLPIFHFAMQEDDEIERVAVVQKAYDAENAILSFITNKTKMSTNKNIQNWLNEILYIRPKLASFELVRLLYNSFQEKQLAMHIMQLPYEENDSWLGLEFPAEMQVGKGKLSVLIHHFPQSAPDWGKSNFSGLLIDEWVEEIPGKEELTGISFQYNQPDSQPPQAMLLAISPTEGKNWNWDTISDIIEDTLRRAKQRAVGTDDLANTDWIGVLPGVLAEFSETKANVSLFFGNR